MSWHSPLAFALLIPLALIMFWLWQSRHRKKAHMSFSSLKLARIVKPSLRMRWAHLPLILSFASLVFMVLALARPQTSSTLTKRNVEGIDIMIVLDVSDSMLIEDMKPLNRLEAAKDTIKNFIAKRISDRVGLIVFAGESFTLVPLTLDYDLLLSRIDEITTAQEARIKDGTAIGVALANGAARLKESTAKSRVMIFLTDGENNSGTIDPETGLEIAKGYDIKIYSIGLGRDGPTRIPVYQKDLFGNRVKSYQPFESTVNEDLLSRMASQTGGRYFRATREDSLQGVFQEINSLEKSKVDVNQFLQFEEQFRSFAWIALALYLLSWLLAQTWLRKVP